MHRPSRYCWICQNLFNQCQSTYYTVCFNISNRIGMQVNITKRTSTWHKAASADEAGNNTIINVSMSTQVDVEPPPPPLANNNNPYWWPSSGFAGQQTKWSANFFLWVHNEPKINDKISVLHLTVTWNAKNSCKFPRYSCFATHWSLLILGKLLLLPALHAAFVPAACWDVFPQDSTTLAGNHLCTRRTSSWLTPNYDDGTQCLQCDYWLLSTPGGIAGNGLCAVSNSNHTHTRTHRGSGIFHGLTQRSIHAYGQP